MDTYLMKTHATMKEYSSGYRIDKDYIAELRIKSDNMSDALHTYKCIVEDGHSMTISDSALKTKQPMYIEDEQGCKQVGYVITASREFQKDNGSRCKQFIDLWVNINILWDYRRLYKEVTACL